MIKKTREKVKELWAELALLSVEMVIIIIFFAVALFLFIYMIRTVFIMEDAGFDERAHTYMSPYINETNNNIMLLFTFLGTHIFLIPANIILIIYFLFIRKHKWYSLKVVAIASSSVLLMFILKNFFARERPLTPLLEAAKGLSFPSGHALNAVTFYGLMGYIVARTVRNKPMRRTLIVAFALIIIMIGVSRVYLNVHYLTDVIAGYSVGIIWLLFSLWSIRKLERYSKRKVEPIVHPGTIPNKEDEL